MQKKKRQQGVRMPDRIRGMRAQRTLDSQGRFTVETRIQTPVGFFSASCPNASSKGGAEAFEVPCTAAIENVNKRIAPHFVGKELLPQGQLDEKLLELDGTPKKFRLGANALISVSMAACKANAAARDLPLFEFLAKISATKKPVLPIPFLAALCGEKKAGIQKALVVPSKFKSFSAALGAGIAVFHSLRLLLHKKGGPNAALAGADGVFAFRGIKTAEESLVLLEQAADLAGFGKKVFFGLDACAGDLFVEEKKQYCLNQKFFSAGELADYYADLAKNFRVVSVEDGCAQNDWQGWKTLTQNLGKKMQVASDDLLASHPFLVRSAVREKTCNSLVIKPSRVGTVSEAIQAAKLAQKAKWMVTVAARSGETNDSFVADLAVGLGCGQCKFGAPNRGQHIAKYNRLLQIEEELGKKAKFGIL